MNDLERLRDTLNRMNQTIGKRLNSQPFGQPHLMSKALAEVQKAFDAPTSELPERSIANALEQYRRTVCLHSFLDLKYTCHGVGHKLHDGWRLLDDDLLFGKLLHQVEGLQAEQRRFRKCYQGLLASYFSYELFVSDSRQNWEYLRKYLADHLGAAQHATPVPGWLTLLAEHRNLLGPNPCARYVQQIRDGGLAEVQQSLQNGLGVARESWVWQELVLSQVEEACRHDDRFYKDELDRLLGMLQSNGNLSVNLVIRCIAMLVSRYAQCSAKPEHPALRDAAVNQIGNPWLKKTAWDARVKNRDGQPDEVARQMINGWIKRELIKNFFELLADDGSADQRRLNYWLRFEPVIDDMWFALGPHAIKHSSPNFKDFLVRAKGRWIKLEASTPPQNNAFIMRLGTVTVVEFGFKGNASYLYRSEGLPFNLGKSWIRGDSAGLKNQRLGERFRHYGAWEERLDSILCQRIGFRPIPAWEEKVAELAARYGLHIEDNRPHEGAFWVLVNNANLHQLAQLGFKFKPGKGWYKE